jgi:hypothetical protein
VKKNVTLTVAKKLRGFKQDAPGSPDYQNSTVLYSLDNLHEDSSFLRTGHPWNKGQLSLFLKK